MKPERIEVKFAVVPEHTDAALQAFEHEEPEKRSIVFFDTPELAFFARGIILRARSSEEEDEGEGDSTFKVRGAKAIDAAKRFLDRIDDATTKLEGDQNVGRDELPSFSITRERDPDEIASTADVASLFGEEVDALLPELRTADVRRFGPIHSQTWKAKIKGLGKVTIELWQSAGLRLLEISDKKERDDVNDFASELADAMAELGLAQLPGSKTERALKSVPSTAIR